MSPPRRRRRRRKKPGRPSDPSAKAQQQPQQPAERGEGSKSKGRNRRRRGRRRSGQSPIPSSPKSSEDLVRNLSKERPGQLTAAPDGQKLEEIIGDLQSSYGVPQYPQEYRLMIKVAEGKDAGSGDGADESPRVVPASSPTAGGPRREKAPAAPLMRPRGDAPPARKKKRGRRRRRKGGGSDGAPGEGSGPEESS